MTWGEWAIYMGTFGAVVWAVMRMGAGWALACKDE